MKMYYRTNLDTDIKYFDFSSFSFSCKEPVMMLDINKDLPNCNVSEYFIPYTKERNKTQIEKLFMGINGFKEKENLPEIIERFANYPETITCKNNSIKTIKGKKISPLELDSFIETLLDSTNIPGLSIAIINDAKIVYHDVFGVTDITTMEPVDNYSLFEAASISKPLFAYFSMLQVDKGLLDLDKPLYEYLPYPDIAYDERYKLITARMILSHTSGFPNWRKDTLNLDFMPGHGFEYSGEGYDYLKMVLAHILKTDDLGLDSIFNAEIVQPIGAINMHCTWNDYLKEHKVMGHKNGKTTDKGPQPPWKPNTFGPGYSLHTESVEYAKFICSIMNNVILRPETQKEMLKKQVDVPANHGFQKYGLSAWSLGFAIETTIQGLRYNHSRDNGDFNSYCQFYKDYNYGIVFMSNSDKLFTTDFTRKLLDFLDEETKL
jgi:CubicO group peptidase (beta-lactamase class C family)